MTKVSRLTLPEMLSMRQQGADFDAIASAAGLSRITAYQRMRRAAGLDAIRPMPGAANDNNPERVTRMMPHNGGCSTTSGKMPVTLKRIPTLDGPAMQVAA